MGVSLADLRKGQEFPEVAFDFSPEWIGQYTAAVDDAAIALLPDYHYPPLALATAALQALLAQVALPVGTLHVAQALSGLSGVELDDIRVLKARVASRGERHGWVLMGIDFWVDDGTGGTLVLGNTTITFPRSTARSPAR